MHLELCRGYDMGPGAVLGPELPHSPWADAFPLVGAGEISPYVSKVAQSWRVAGDNRDDWRGGTRVAIESFVNNSRLAGPHGWNYGARTCA